MNEAQLCRHRLENLQGSVTSEDILFGDEVIAKKGETIGREHIVMVQDHHRAADGGPASI